MKAIALLALSYGVCGYILHCNMTTDIYNWNGIPLGPSQCELDNSTETSHLEIKPYYGSSVQNHPFNISPGTFFSLLPTPSDHMLIPDNIKEYESSKRFHASSHYFKLKGGYKITFCSPIQCKQYKFNTKIEYSLAKSNKCHTGNYFPVHYDEQDNAITAVCIHMSYYTGPDHLKPKNYLFYITAKVVTTYTSIDYTGTNLNDKIENTVNFPENTKVFQRENIYVVDLTNEINPNREGCVLTHNLIHRTSPKHALSYAVRTHYYNYQFYEKNGKLLMESSTPPFPHLKSHATIGYKLVFQTFTDDDFPYEIPPSGAAFFRDLSSRWSGEEDGNEKGTSTKALEYRAFVKRMKERRESGKGEELITKEEVEPHHYLYSWQRYTQNMSLSRDIAYTLKRLLNHSTKKK